MWEYVFEVWYGIGQDFIGIYGIQCFVDWQIFGQIDDVMFVICVGGFEVGVFDYFYEWESWIVDVELVGIGEIVVQFQYQVDVVQVFDVMQLLQIVGVGLVFYYIGDQWQCWCGNYMIGDDDIFGCLYLLQFIVVVEVLYWCLCNYVVVGLCDVFGQVGCN